MKKFLNIIAIIFLLLSFGAWTELGLNFRETAPYVTDGAGETYVLGETTSTTRGGATFQWDVCSDCARDRSSSVTPALAGVNQKANNGTPITFSLVIDPGTYTICLALGDADNDQTYQKAEVFDDASPLFSVVDTDGTATGHFDDATGVDRTAANYVATQVCQTGQVVGSTTLRVKLGSTSPTSGNSTLAHLYVEQESASTPTPTPTPSPSPTPTPGSVVLKFNFRESAPLVVDGADETYVLGETSDQFRNGVHFHWDSCSDCARDRSALAIPELAGINQKSNDGTPSSFLVTLPSPGTYDVCLALGDLDNVQSYQKAEVFDNTTSLFSVVDTDGTADGHFDDATGVDRTTASWSGSQVCQTGLTFTTTNFVLKLGSTTLQGNASTIAHLAIQQLSASPTPTPSASPTAVPGGDELSTILEGLGEL